MKSRCLMLLACALVWANCGLTNIGNSNATCAAGTTCTCDILGNCMRDCPGGHCSFICKNDSNCDFTCAGGGCSVLCENTGNCILDSCTGGNCTVTCMGNTGNCICMAGCGMDMAFPQHDMAVPDLPEHDLSAPADMTSETDGGGTD